MKKSLLILTALAAGGAFADTYWTGRTLSDWSADGAWTGSGNHVFGGNGTYLKSTDPHVVLFSKPETITRLWIENNDKGKIVWKLADEATEDAGLTMNGPNDRWGHAMNLGTGKHGELVIESGTYHNKGQLWLANGNAESSMTLNGGTYLIDSYTCISYGTSAGRGILNVNGGLYKETGGVFIVSQSNNADNEGIFNQTGGEVVTSGEVFLAERAGKGIMNISGGEFTIGSYMSAPRGGSTTGEINLTGGTMTCNNIFQLAYGGSSTGTLVVDGGTLKAKANFYAGYGGTSKAVIDMKSGTFDTDGEMILGTATGANVEMTLSGGTFTPKKLWVASHYSHSNGGVTAKLTMTGGTLETLQTGNGEDFVIGGNGAATGTFEMQGGRVNVGQTLYVGWRGTGIMKMSGGDVYLRAGKEMSIGSKESASTSGSVELTGGTIHTDTVNMQTAYGEKTFLVNGGTFAPVTDTATWLSKASFTVGENGIGLNADGHTATLCANLVPAEEDGKIKAVIKGSGSVNFAEATLAQIDTIAVADGGLLAFTMGDELAKPIEIQEGGRLTIDVTGIVTDGAYDLGTFAGGLTLAEGVTLSSENVTLIGLPGSANAAYTISETGVLSVTLSGLEKLVFNSDNVAWGAENVWKGEKSGVAKTFGATDKAVFRIEEDETVQTVLVNEEIAPMGVEVIATGANSYPLIKGHGTFAPQELSVKGTIGLAGDEEGPLNLNVKLESTMDGETNLSKALFESGTVNLLTSLHMDSINNATLVRTSNWQPSYRMTGTGDVVLSNATLTVSALDRFGGYDGSLTLAEGAILSYDLPIHESGTPFGLGPNVKVRMAGGQISRFGRANGSNNEAIKDLEIVEGTTSSISNEESRGRMGCNVDIVGAVTGSGTLSILCSGRRVKFHGDFAGFSGRMNLSGTAYEFVAGIKGGTFDMAAGTVVQGGIIPVDNSTLILRNTNPNIDYQIGAKATLGATSTATAKSVSFVEGAKFEFVDEGALSNSKTDYVALTVTNPIAGPLPTIANANAVTTRGKWKLVQRANKKTVTDPDTGVESEETESYSLVAQFRPLGLCIILQ